MYLMYLILPLEQFNLNSLILKLVPDPMVPNSLAEIIAYKMLSNILYLICFY
jgi:hypothetical protein